MTSSCSESTTNNTWKTFNGNAFKGCSVNESVNNHNIIGYSHFPTLLSILLFDENKHLELTVNELNKKITENYLDWNPLQNELSHY